MSDRRPIIAANWKMHKTHLEAIRDVQKLSYLLGADDAKKVEVVIVPPFTALRAVQILIDSDRLQYSLGAQNVHWEDKGAFTGEVSPRMLAEMGVRLVIVGHSERRIHFGETDDRIQRKVAAVRRHGMVPILCVGEQEKERDEGRTLAVVEKQLRLGLGKLAVSDGSEIVIAYEPVWAIGTGRSATPGQAQEVHRMIREQLGGMFPPAAASRVRILYGGSANAETALDLLRLPEVDGALVGGASLDAAAFAAIVAATG